MTFRSKFLVPLIYNPKSMAHEVGEAKSGGQYTGGLEWGT